MRILNLGCGRRELPVTLPKGHHAVISLDADPLLKPHIVCRLGVDTIPLDDNSIDLAVAFHVLEHIGKQCDTREWFQFWEELYRVMKPGGRVQFQSPLSNSVWTWSDPSHTRALNPLSFLYFDQNSYRNGSGISPFRINCDFESVSMEPIADANPEVQKFESHSHFNGVLWTRKPLLTWWESDEINPSNFAQHSRD